MLGAGLGAGLHDRLSAGAVLAAAVLRRPGRQLPVLLRELLLLRQERVLLTGQVLRLLRIPRLLIGGTRGATAVRGCRALVLAEGLRLLDADVVGAGAIVRSGLLIERACTVVSMQRVVASGIGLLVHRRTGLLVDGRAAVVVLRRGAVIMLRRGAPIVHGRVAVIVDGRAAVIVSRRGAVLVLRMRRGRSAADGRTARRRAGTGRAMVAPCRAICVTVIDDGGVPAVAMAGAMIVSARGVRVAVGAVSVAGIRVEAIRLGELLLDGAALLLDPVRCLAASACRRSAAICSCSASLARRCASRRARSASSSVSRAFRSRSWTACSFCAASSRICAARRLSASCCCALRLREAITPTRTRMIRRISTSRTIPMMTGVDSSMVGSLRSTTPARSHRGLPACGAIGPDRGPGCVHIDRPLSRAVLVRHPTRR